jgi:hypothetical protein
MCWEKSRNKKKKYLDAAHYSQPEKIILLILHVKIFGCGPFDSLILKRSYI